MPEACDQYGVYLSITMANLQNEAAVQRQYAHSIRVDEDVDYGEWYKLSDKNRGQRFINQWSHYANAMDGFAYWSYLSGQNRLRLDGDFIRMNTYATDSERRTAMSAHLMAGGLVGVADQYDTIGNSIWVYQNPEMLALNADDFAGKPLTNDPTNQNSQIWTGTMSNGDTIVGLFNRETTAQTRSLVQRHRTRGYGQRERLVAAGRPGSDELRLHGTSAAREYGPEAQQRIRHLYSAVHHL